MTFAIKICGLTTDASVVAAAESGATEVGFVFAESPRRIGVELAKKLAGVAPALKRIAVFRHPRTGDVARVLGEVPIDCVQSDAADAGTIVPELCGVPFRPVYRDGPDLAAQVARGAAAGLNDDPVLVEGPASGAGIAPDWPRIANLQPLRFLLAGGLTPANVADAIRIVRPCGVDASSGVESAPGVKDPALIRAFVLAARAAHAACGARP